jgi:hypothetical protein
MVDMFGLVQLDVVADDYNFIQSLYSKQTTEFLHANCGKCEYLRQGGSILGI